jgi:peptidoglycan/xylan/chitin deacetylase (PgdA/CDA1 family)
MGSAAPRIVAINYHFVRASNPGRFRLRAHERSERFDAQLAQLAGRFPLLRCSELFARAGGSPGVVITFDDGARDVFEQALPLLQRHGAAATAFVCSRPYLEGRLLQIQKVEYLMSELSLEGFRRAFYGELERRFPGQVERESLAPFGGYAFYRYDEEPIRRFKLDLNYQLPYPIVEPILDALFEHAFGPGSEADAVRETYMSLDQLKRLVDAGVEIGSHSHAHRVLPRLGYLDQKREIETSIDFLRHVTGDSRISLSYPFSFHDEATLRAAGELDLLAGFALGRRAITDDDIRSRWSVPRYDVNDCFDRSSNQPIREVFADLAS